jgi:hypothetical protein
MYTDGKSDDSIVPSTRTNKAATAVAESVQERESPKRSRVSLEVGLPAQSESPFSLTFAGFREYRQMVGFRVQGSRNEKKTLIEMLQFLQEQLEIKFWSHFHTEP